MSDNLKLVEIGKAKDQRQTRRFLIGVGIGVFLGSVAAIFMPLIVTSFSLGTLGVSESNAIGDTIGGIMGPSIGLIGAVLTFLAFYAQIRANTEQRHQFRQSLLQQEAALEKQTTQFKQTLEQQENAIKLQKQQSDEQIRIAKEQAENAGKEFLIQDIAARKDRFANRYYMMMSVHRDNVAAFDVGRPKQRYTGRRALLPLFNELEFLYWTSIAFNENDWAKREGNKALSEHDIFQISYLSFFFGFGNVSTPMVLDLVGPMLFDFTDALHEHFESIKKNKNFSIKTSNGKLDYDDEYDLGTGHLRRLSHYFRHLFQTVKYVDDQDPELIDYDEKYSYVSNLRAQLSVHEQLLLYYNARSVLGKPWLDFDLKKGEKEGLLSRYCVIKSIPLNTASFYEKPEKFFNDFNQEGKAMFEWTEIRKRIIQQASI